MSAQLRLERMIVPNKAPEIPTAVRRAGLRAFAIATILAFAGLVVPLANAQDQFPSRTIRLIVPTLPGGAIDLASRLFSAGLEKELGVPVVVENRPGAAGANGAVAVKMAAPDGYTLFMGHNGTHAVNPSLFTHLPYDPIKDFRPISLLVSWPSILIVSVDGPKTVAELVDLAKRKSSGLNFASQGIGSGGHVLGEIFRSKIGAPMVHVPYRGAVAGITDVATGRVDFMFTSYVSALPFLQDRRLKILGITSATRSRLAPEVPTMAEIGYPGMEVDAWYGVLAPAGTPDAVIARLHDAFAKVARSREIVEMGTSQASDIVAGTPKAFSEVIATDLVRLGKVMRDAGVAAAAKPE